MTAEVKEFATGSLGWYLNGKANISVGEKSVSVQIGMNLTIVGSKELPKSQAGVKTKPPTSVKCFRVRLLWQDNDEQHGWRSKQE